MKVNNIKVENNLSNLKAQKSAKNVNFGGFGTAIGNLNKAAMNYIEHGGFFAEFVLLDTVALVLPRVYQGFQRNKKELGHLNYQAGTEEFLREFITGPSLFIIPITAVILAGKALGKCTQINSAVMKKFTDAFSSMAQNIKSSNLIENQKNFANKIFKNLFENHPQRLQNINIAEQFKLDKYNQNFTDIIIESLGQTGKVLKESRAKFVDLISDINTTHFNKKNTFGVDFIIEGQKKTHVSSAGDLFDDLRKYMQDFIPSTKLTIEETAAKTGDEVKNIIDKIAEIRRNGRKLLTLGGTAALAGFLSIIPIIYQRSKTNPALNGLPKETEKRDK